MTLITLTDQDSRARVSNLRHHLARYIYIARSGQQLDCLSLDDDLRTLVALCPDDAIESANRLMHDVRNKITRVYGRKRLAQLIAEQAN